MIYDPNTSADKAGSPSPKMAERPFQFTLMHLCLGVLGVSILLGISVPLIRQANREAERMQCGNNLKQIGIALHTYHDAWKCFPPVIRTDVSGKPMHSWRVLIVPFLESSAWYSYYDLSEAWNGPNNRKLAGSTFSCYRCPSDRRTKPEMTNYVAIYGPGTAWDVNRGVRLDEITDGTSNTILVVEIRNSDIHWMEPRDIHIKDLKIGFNAKDGLSLGSYHIKGAMIAKADGSAHLLSPDEIDEHLQAMLTVAGSEPVHDSSKK